MVDPAAYVANGGDTTDYGNYDITNRPVDMSIDDVIIHDTEGTCQAAVDHFKDPKAYVSAHYVICKDGTVIQMVRTKDFAWHVGNWWMNGHSIGIEHEGHAAAGDYTYAQYRASAELVRYLTGRFNIPRDRNHILGHDNVMAAPNSALTTMHTDPGPFWNWALYMTMVSGLPSLPSALKSNFVTVAPTWPLSQELVTGCAKDDPMSCVSGGPRPTNFIYLRTEPRDNAPLINDVVMGTGSTEVANNAARVFYGQTFALAEPPYKAEGGVTWYRIFVNGGTGWFRSPWNAPTGLPVANSKVKYVTPKPEKGDLPVYARPIPDKSETCPQTTCEYGYPTAVITPPSPGSYWIKDQQALPYVLGADQKYVVIDPDPPTDYFYAWSSDGDDEKFPGDHSVYRGATKYVGIQFGGHIAYVKKDYVDCTNC